MWMVQAVLLFVFVLVIVVASLVAHYFAMPEGYREVPGKTLFESFAEWWREREQKKIHDAAYWKKQTELARREATRLELELKKVGPYR
jgi:hypothetical protein